MINLKMREFTIAVTNFVNSSPLPTEFKRMSILEVLRQLEEKASQEIQEEIMKRDSEQKEVRSDAKSVSEN